MEYYNPVKVLIKQGGVMDIGTILQDTFSETKSVLLVIGKKSFEESKYYSIIHEKLAEYNVFVYRVNNSNPSIDEIYDGYNIIKKFKFEVIIAIGGGSVLDTAKIFSITRNVDLLSRDEFDKYILEGKYKENRKRYRLIAIPTTVGTGSEVTPFAVVWDKNNKKKYSVDDISLYPDIALLDVNLIMSLPKAQVVITALDALSHGVEGYWAKRGNDISRIYSLISIELIIKNLELAIKNPEDVRYKEKLLIASMFAGKSISKSRTTLGHAISYILTMKYDIPHGLAVGIILPHVYELNYHHIEEIEKLKTVLGNMDSSELKIWIKDICDLCNIETSLNYYGFKIDDIDEICKNANVIGRSDNNPIKITNDETKNIIYKVK